MEKNRIVQIQTLFDLCNNIIVKMTGDQLEYIINLLNIKQRDLLTSLLPVDLPSHLSLSLGLGDEYWKRKCFERHWTRVNYWLCWCNWKNTFVSYHAEELIDSYISGKLSFSDVISVLTHYQTDLSSLKINGFKLDYSGNSYEDLSEQLPIENNIFKIIQMFPSLKEIHLRNFPINYEVLFETKMDDLFSNSYKVLGNILSQYRCLQKLTVTGTQMKLCHFSEFVNNVASSRTITDLNLSCNLLTDDFCVSISHLLKTSSIQKLALSNNDITNIGAKTIALALSGNVSLTSLYLDKNCLEDEGAAAILQSLISNIHLQTLSIAYNDIGYNCTPIFKMLLKRNKTLQFLDFSGSSLGEEAGDEILEAVRSNTTILYIGCQNCDFSSETEDFIHLHISHNYLNNQQY